MRINAERTQERGKTQKRFVNASKTQSDEGEGYATRDPSLVLYWRFQQHSYSLPPVGTS